jgi:hypothetical protein
MAKPPITSLDSMKDPSVTLTFPLVEGTPAERAWQAALSGNQPTGLHPLFDQLAHFVHFLLCWGCVSFHLLVHAQKFHRISLYLCFEFGSIASNYRSDGLNYAFLPACF